MKNKAGGTVASRENHDPGDEDFPLPNIPRVDGLLVPRSAAEWRAIVEFFGLRIALPEVV